MSLASLFYPPPTPAGFEEFAFSNYQHHQAIIDAARTVKNVTLTLYQIWPVNPRNFQQWLAAHQQQHDDMNALYGVPGSDLTSLDLNDPRQVEAFFLVHASEHRDVAQKSGLPI